VHGTASLSTRARAQQALVLECVPATQTDPDALALPPAADRPRSLGRFERVRLQREKERAVRTRPPPDFRV
jgi:hypothetical protein